MATQRKLVATEEKKNRGGRPRLNYWLELKGLDPKNNGPSSYCKHCSSSQCPEKGKINHFGKVDIVRNHLKKCKPYQDHIR